MTETTTANPVHQGIDRTPRSLALVLATAAERVRTDPAANFTDGAVRGAARVLSGRLGTRLYATRRRRRAGRFLQRAGRVLTRRA
jgi:hypothetical protein